MVSSSAWASDAAVAKRSRGAIARHFRQITSISSGMSGRQCRSVRECPVEAIYWDDDVPEKWHEYIALNAQMVPKRPQITGRKEPLAGRS